MAKSVNYLNGAQLILFKSIDQLEEWEQENFESDLIYDLKEIAPSLEMCEKWEDKEVKIILENGLVEIGVSEYNGIASISFRAKDYNDFDYYVEGMGKRWIEQLENKFIPLGDLRRIGTLSNGEGLFESIDGIITSSKEGVLNI